LKPKGKQHVMRDFKKLMIWQLGMDIVDKVYDIVPHLPLEEKFGLRSQMTRSASSIPSNIAEGSAKRSVKEYIRYVEMSQGSAFELETHTLVVSRRKWVSEELINQLLDMVMQEQKMISKFIDRLDGE
jgi:four helix bundle protein